MKKFPPFLLSFLSGAFFYLAWPVKPFTIFIFVAFIPILMLAKQCQRRGAFFGWTYLALVLWNASTTWWVSNASVPGGISAVLANSLLMSIPLIGYYNVSRRMGDKFGGIAFVFFWMCFEYIHLNWQLSWPWLTLGNVFATKTGWIQWYEITGTSGGSLWVLVINFLLFQLMRAPRPWTKPSKQLAGIFMAILLLPVLVSYLILHRETKNVNEELSGPVGANVVVVQPDVDPWTEKFAAGQQEAQVNELIRLSDSLIDPKTRLVVWPETAIPVAINEDSIRHTYFMNAVWDFLRRNPGVSLLTGIEGFRFLTEQNKTIFATKIPHTNIYSEQYNSAAMMDSSHVQLYHKSKFVPGVEALPTFLFFMASWFDQLGGVSDSYAPQEERTVLNTHDKSFAVAPAVCYESIFGEFMAEYVRGGATVIAIITNDGWWGDTPGYHQHESYAKLRAIENRRWVLRSANTGISCFIDPTGQVINPQEWDKRTAIKMTVPTSRSLTFFSRHGDLLSRLVMWASLLLVIWNIVFIVKSRSKRV